MKQYEVIYQTRDSEALEARIVSAETQVAAMKKLAAFVSYEKRIVDFIFSVTRVGA